MSKTSINTGVGEHKLESWMIAEMRKATAEKFVGSLSQIQPITVGGCPFAVPVPLKASDGAAKKGDGHIDILARRRGEDNRVRLSVWELKDEGKLADAVRQVYIYSVALILMLRASSSGPRWWKLFGFNGALSKKFEIEAVVAVSKGVEAPFKKQWEEAKGALLLDRIGGRDSIRFYAAYYDPAVGSIKLVELKS